MRGHANLSDHEWDVLAQRARAAIRTGCAGAPPTPFAPVSDCLQEPAAVFVTLYQGGELRGCVGTLEATQPLSLAVERMARAAAFDDHRFPLVRPEEVDSLAIEISVLSPLQRVSRPEDILVGYHGVVVVSDNRRAVFLPKVASEQGWNRTTLLDELCRKAGLPARTWRNEDTALYVFTVSLRRTEPASGATGATDNPRR